MIAKEFDAISKADIDALVAKEEPERRTLEYKLKLPEKNDDAVREFLADASSFANAGGGDLLYGMRDKLDEGGKPTGIPEEAVGLAGINAGAEELTLTNRLRDGIDPRIPGVRIKHLEGFPSGPVILLRIPKSWASPHMVKFRGGSRFYSRTSAGKFQLDVREIRTAFAASESTAQRIGAFRSERVGKILAGETPVPLEPLPKLALHLLPIQAFSEPAALDMRAAYNDWEKTMGKSKPMGRPPVYEMLRFNYHGLFFFGGRGDSSGKSQSYVQLFRNGALEAVSASISKDAIISGSRLEEELMRVLGDYVEFQTRLGVGPPLFVALSVISAKGLDVQPTLQSSFNEWFRITPIPDDVLLAPEVLVEDEGTNIRKALRPALDTIWQASGWPGSQCYDEAGNWVGYMRG